MFLVNSRPHPAPVRDEDAESQRKAKSRQARQSRRSTQVNPQRVWGFDVSDLPLWPTWSCVDILQGVTLTDLKEAQTTYSLSHQNRETEEGTLDHRSSLWRGFTDAEGDTSVVRAADVGLKWSITDKVSWTASLSEFLQWKEATHWCGSIIQVAFLLSACAGGKRSAPGKPSGWLVVFLVPLFVWILCFTQLQQLIQKWAI